MSTFKVSVEKVSEVSKHPNADTLDVCRVESLAYQFLTGRGEVARGDLVVYFPVDSVLPEKVKNVLPEAVVKKLSGKNNDRIQTVTLRGLIAQGLQIPVSKFPIENFSEELHSTGAWKTPGFDLTPVLGVTKYEPPEEFSRKGVMIKTLPLESPYYDIESCDRFLDALAVMKQRVVMITEKVEGTHFSIVAHVTGDVDICQRSFKLVPENPEDPQDTYWKAAVSTGLIEKAKTMAKRYGKCVTIRGELIGPGIQKNIYKLNNHKILIFDLMFDGQYVGASDFMDMCAINDLETVPIIDPYINFEQFIGSGNLGDLADGESKLSPGVAREGIVVRPLQEEYLLGFGRLILKQHGLKYSAKNQF